MTDNPLILLYICLDIAAARRYFKRAVGINDVPDRIAIDKSGANLAGLQRHNVIQKFAGVGRIVGVVQSKYRNNIVEQDHRFIKRIPRPMLGFKAFRSAAATLAGIETAHMIRKGRLDQTGVSACKQFATLAAELCPSKTVLQPSENFATEPARLVLTFSPLRPRIYVSAAQVLAFLRRLAFLLASCRRGLRAGDDGPFDDTNSACDDWVRLWRRPLTPCHHSLK